MNVVVSVSVCVCVFYLHLFFVFKVKLFKPPPSQRKLKIQFSPDHQPTGNRVKYVRT